MTESGIIDDPYAMYYVVRKDARLTWGQSMAIAGAAAVACRKRFRDDERFRQAFDAWDERPRKIALRASAEEMDEVKRELPCAVEGDDLLCLPPMRKSARPQLLVDMRPFTDAPRPKEEPVEPESPALAYVIRPGVIKTMGKAMAQAGHAATAAWVELGVEAAPAIVRAADDEVWQRLREAPETVVVADGGHTQVAPGTETVIALAPDARVDGLSRVP
jgi:peptidyl-tRNA hydrolase